MGSRISAGPGTCRAFDSRTPRNGILSIRHELYETWSVPQPSQRKTCPPSAALRHCSMADITLS